MTANDSNMDIVDNFKVVSRYHLLSELGKNPEYGVYRGRKLVILKYDTDSYSGKLTQGVKKAYYTALSRLNLISKDSDQIHNLKKEVDDYFVDYSLGIRNEDSMKLHLSNFELIRQYDHLNTLFETLGKEVEELQREKDELPLRKKELQNTVMLISRLMKKELEKEKKLNDLKQQKIQLKKEIDLEKKELMTLRLEKEAEAREREKNQTKDKKLAEEIGRKEKRSKEWDQVINEKHAQVNELKEQESSLKKRVNEKLFLLQELLLRLGSKFQEKIRMHPYIASSPNSNYSVIDLEPLTTYLTTQLLASSNLPEAVNQKNQKTGRGFLNRRRKI